VRTKDDPQIFDTKCGCGKPLGNGLYHKPCNLVFCGDCFPLHRCKPVNGPICPEGPKPTALLPQAPAPAAPAPAGPLLESPRNGSSHKSTPKKRKR